MIPERCRRCVWWMGHRSGDADDWRCDREWGWSMPELGEPRRVAPDCRVRLWGESLPRMDEHGNPLPGLTPSPWVDAFIPIKEHPLILVRIGDRVYHATLEALLELMKTGDLFRKRTERIESITKKHITIHKHKLGTDGLITLASEQPPWEDGRERIPTGLVQLDWALGGGITPGTTIGLWGEKHVGKSTLRYYLEGVILRYYRQKVYEHLLAETGDEEAARQAADDERGLAIATEGYDSSYARRLGVPVDQVIRPRCEYGEQYLQYVIDHVKDNLHHLQVYQRPDVYSYMLPVTIRYYSVDSVDSLKWWADDHGARGKESILHDNVQIGARAQILSQFFRMASAAPSIPITSIYITQERTNIAGAFAYKDGLRGNAFAHNLRLEIRLKRAKQPEGRSVIVELEFRQLQMPGGTRLVERQTLPLVFRTSGGIYARDQVVWAAAELGILEIRGGGHWKLETPQGEVTSSTTGLRTSDLVAIADALEETDPSIISWLYDEVSRSYAERVAG